MSIRIIYQLNALYFKVPLINNHHRRPYPNCGYLNHKHEPTKQIYQNNNVKLFFHALGLISLHYKKKQDTHQLI